MTRVWLQRVRSDHFDCYNLIGCPHIMEKKLKNEWQPIFLLMEEVLNIPDKIADITTKFIEESYDNGLLHLKSRASYIWEKPHSRLETWSISTWSRSVRFSSIQKYGNNNDRNRLPAATKRNTPREDLHERTKWKKQKI